MATLAQQWRGSGGLAAREREAFQEALTVALNAYEAGPWAVSPVALREQLQNIVSEVDPWQIWEILDSQEWGSGYTGNLADERKRAMDESARMFRRSPLHQWCIWTWGSWAMGDAVAVSVTGDDAAHVVAQEFWGAERNAGMLGADNISVMSDWVLQDGNTFLVYYGSDQDGETTLSELAVDEVTDIITHPQDKNRPLFYKRQFTEGSKQRTWYYPDHVAYFGDKLDAPYPGDENGRTLAQVVLPRGAYRVDIGRVMDAEDTDEQLGDVRAVTGVCIQHIAHNRKERGSLWGWPLATVAWPWIGGHKKFTESRLTVAEAKAMYVRRKKVTGGSRALAGVRGTIASNLSRTQLVDTNPPAAAGSTELENAMVETTDLPMTTGASDAKTDNELFAWLPLLGEGLLPTSAGLDTTRWATALQMDRTQSMLFSRYRAFWRVQFQRMLGIVLRMKERFGSGKFANDLSIVIAIDNLTTSDFADVAEALGGLSKNMLQPYLEMGLLDADVARRLLAGLWRVCLQALSVSGTEDLFWDADVKPTPAEERTIERLSAVIAQNAREGAVDWQAAAEWAFEELRE